MDLWASIRAAAAAGVIHLVAACGGGDSIASGSATPAAAVPAVPDPLSTSTKTGAAEPGPKTCQPPFWHASSGSGRQTGTTIIGGDLFVAEQGPVEVTLLSVADLKPGDPLRDTYLFRMLYDVVFGATVSNRQNHYRWAMPFPAGTPVSASAQVEFERPPADMVFYTPPPTTYPKGVPIQLWLQTVSPTFSWERNSSTTASIGKDLGHSYEGLDTASVTYGPNNTATVTFRCEGCGDLTVGLTNVYGSACL